MAYGVSRELARRAVAITDKRHPNYNMDFLELTEQQSSWFCALVRGVHAELCPSAAAAVGGVEILQFCRRCPFVRMEDAAPAQHPVAEASRRCHVSGGPELAPISDVSLQ
jgi:hypothetical protein